MKIDALADLQRRFGLRHVPSTRSLVWGVSGLILGIVATAAVLLLAAPEPPAVVQQLTATSDVSITINDAVLTNLVAAGVAQAGLPFSVTNVQAQIQPSNVVKVSGDVPILNGLATRRLSAAASLGVQDGHIVMHISNASLGNLGLPAILIGAIERAFDAKSAQFTDSLVVGDTHYVVSGVSSTSGTLTLHLQQQ